MKKIVTIPLEAIGRMEIVVSGCRETMAQVKSRTGADLILNGGMWNADGTPCRGLKVAGELLSATPWGDLPGYGWDGPGGLRQTLDWQGVENYIAVSPLIVDGTPLEPIPYDSAQGGRRPRSAMGIMGDSLLLYCADDPIAPEELRDELAALGCASAMMLDCGGSSQCDFDGATITAERRVHNWIAVWRKKEAAEPPDEEDDIMSDQPIVCLDPGHGPGTVNGAPDGSYKELEFTWDMYERLWTLLEAQGVAVVGTRAEDERPSLTARAAVSNLAGADLFVSIHSNAAGNDGWYNASGFIAYTSSGPETMPRNKAAKAILARVKEAGIKLFSTPLAHERYTVLTATTSPAVLLECAFHTSREDVENLKDPAWRDKLARAVCAGICDHLGMEFQEADEEPGTPDEADEWAREAWDAAKRAGLMDGTRPRDPLTRQEAAVLLAQLGKI